MKWRSISCVWLCDAMDYTVHGILQARIMEWVAIPFSRGSSQPTDWTQVSCIAGRIFTSWATGRHITNVSPQLLKVLWAFILGNQTQEFLHSGPEIFFQKFWVWCPVFKLIFSTHGFILSLYSVQMDFSIFIPIINCTYGQHLRKSISELPKRTVK